RPPRAAAPGAARPPRRARGSACWPARGRSRARPAGDRDRRGATRPRAAARAVRRRQRPPGARAGPPRRSCRDAHAAEPIHRASAGPPPRRVLFTDATQGGVLGGSLTGVLELIAHLDRRRFEPSLVLFEPKSIAADLRAQGLDVHVLPSPHGPALVSRRSR